MRKKLIAILLAAAALLAAVVMLCRIPIYLPSETKLVFKAENEGIDIEEPLTREETVAVKGILFGKIRWPESLYGYPACGFGTVYSIEIDGNIYMLSWDSCNFLCVMPADSDSDECSYINISEAERDTIEEIFRSHEEKNQGPGDLQGAVNE